MPDGNVIPETVERSRATGVVLSIFVTPELWRRISVSRKVNLSPPHAEVPPHPPAMAEILAITIRTYLSDIVSILLAVVTSIVFSVLLYHFVYIKEYAAWVFPGFNVTGTV